MDDIARVKARCAYNYYHAAIALCGFLPDKEEAKERIYGYLFDALADDDLTPSGFVSLAIYALLDV